MGGIRNLRIVDLNTASRVFNMKVFLVLAYCLREIGPRLSAPNLHQLEIVYSAFLKSVLCLSRNVSATLCHELVGTPFLMESMLECINVKDPERTRYLTNLEKRRLALASQNYTEGPAFKSRAWAGSLQKNRHWITAFTAYGFNHLLCSDT